MTHLSDRMAEVKAEGRAALIGYLPVGYPSLDQSIEAFTALVEAGADVVEVGMPYTDPVLDGTVIQQAGVVALDGGVRVTDLFIAVKAVIAAGAPAVVMTYYNPLLQYGLEKFADDLLAAGIALALDVETWHTLSETQGLSNEQATDLMVRLTCTCD